MIGNDEHFKTLLHLQVRLNPSPSLLGWPCPFCTYLNKCAPLQRWNILMYFSSVVAGKSPELGDIQWNETATSDGMIVTLLFLLLLKKAIYFPQPLKMCYDFRASQRKIERLDEERADRLFPCTYAGVCCPCDKELALILLVVTVVSAETSHAGPWV